MTRAAETEIFAGPNGVCSLEQINLESTRKIDAQAVYRAAELQLNEGELSFPSACKTNPVAQVGGRIAFGLIVAFQKSYSQTGVLGR